MDQDLEGAAWPPPDALVARVANYPNPSMVGATVELGVFEDGYFHCFVIESPNDPARTSQYRVLLQQELQPLNETTQSYITGVTVGDTQVYQQDVYDLRDALGVLGIQTTAIALSAMTCEQFQRVQGWVTLVKGGGAAPRPLPGVLR